MAQVLGSSGMGKVAFAANVVAPLAKFSGLGSLFFAQPRKIGTLIPGVVLEEDGRDEMEITQHPVEHGAPITDHAYMRPAELMMRCAWSASLFGQPYLRAIYMQLQQMQASRQPITVSTGKRVYKNMLIRVLSAGTTGPQDENLLNVTCTFQEVLLVRTYESLVSPREQQAQAHNTARPQSTGTVTPIRTANTGVSAATDPGFDYTSMTAVHVVTGGVK